MVKCTELIQETTRSPRADLANVGVSWPGSKEVRVLDEDSNYHGVYDVTITFSRCENSHNF